MILHVLCVGDKLSVDGEHTLAVEAWKEQLKHLAGKTYIVYEMFSLEEGCEVLKKWVFQCASKIANSKFQIFYDKKF